MKVPLLHPASRGKEVGVVLRVLLGEKNNYFDSKQEVLCPHGTVPIWSSIY
jgi:hypothetical protein